MGLVVSPRKTPRERLSDEVFSLSLLLNCSFLSYQIKSNSCLHSVRPYRSHPHDSPVGGCFLSLHVRCERWPSCNPQCLKAMHYFAVRVPRRFTCFYTREVRLWRIAQETMTDGPAPPPVLRGSNRAHIGHRTRFYANVMGPFAFVLD